MLLLPHVQIMMLKLRGHPPILMKKQDGGNETQLSTLLSKVHVAECDTHACVVSQARPSQQALAERVWLVRLHMHEHVMSAHVELYIHCII